MTRKREISLNIVIILTLVLSFLVIVLSRFESPIRFWYSIKYFGIDAFNYLRNFFDQTDFNYPRLYNFITRDGIIPDSDFTMPETYENFFVQSRTFFMIFFNRWNLESFLFNSLTVLILIFQLIYFVFLMFFPIRILFNNQFTINDLEFVNKSRPLIWYEWFVENVIDPVKEYVLDYLRMLYDYKFYFIPFVIIWGIQLNLFSVFIDAFGFLFHFSASFRFVSIYEFVYTTVYTMYPLLSKIPLLIYLLIGLWVFKVWQKKMAIHKMYHLDRQNKGFAKSLGVVINVQGPPRSSKTTMVNSLGQDFDEIFRADFLDILERQSSLFPLFPWIELEKVITVLRDNGELPNRYAIEKLIKSFFSGDNFNFNYDFDETYKFEIGLGNKVISLPQAMQTYAEAYYYYSYPGSLVSANFSNRFDSIMIQQNEEKPKLMLWNYPALIIDPFDSRYYQHFSKNIDFDSFRLLKRVNPKSIPPLTDIGIFLEMEASKQWGNQHDNKMFKRDDVEANPLNDGFAMFLSSFAHASLIDYTPFIRYIMDYQRAGDLAIKFSGMAETKITIVPTEQEMRITLPFFYLTPLFYGFFINLRKKLYTRKFRHYRSDQTLLFTLINRLGSWATRRMLILTNNYAFKVLKITTSSGTEDSGLNLLKEKRYFIINKKHYSDRFRSDALKVIYSDNEKMGFHSFENFTQLDMTDLDLEYQKSYSFLNRFRKTTNEEIDNKPLF